MSSYLTLATCNLNQWALDFEGNRDRILESIRIAKERGARLRVGPELEVCGYGCLDHFLEHDVFDHCWDMYEAIVLCEDAKDMLLDVGMPVLHRGVSYNCRLLLYNGKILLVRPKLFLANDGNYREMRYFSPWLKARYVEEYKLPKRVARATGQLTVPFGDAVVATADTVIGAETCEELFTPQAPHIAMSLDGVEIITNLLGLHHELRKLNTRMGLITEATTKCGGVYLYSNQRGCDGDRLYYDGCALIAVNGHVVAQGLQFGLLDVEVVTATVDLNEVRAYRRLIARGLQAVQAKEDGQVYQRVRVEADLCPPDSRLDSGLVPLKRIELRYHLPEEEIALGPACWLWDYLRRCKAAGFMLPLSGGIDLCATAVIVHLMTRLVCAAVAEGNAQVLADVRALTGKEAPWVPELPQEVANLLFHTAYLGTENLSEETRSRAKVLAGEIGAHHTDLNMDTLVLAVVRVFEVATGKRPVFKVFGGLQTENLALQNIQARLRMVLTYMFAQLLPWIRGRQGGLLVLGLANVDECLRGYLTKYDCLLADINPIGGISKTDLKRFIGYAEREFGMPVLHEFLTAVPTAELEPITETYVQSDEADMGMTYDELSVFGRLRKVDKCGPYLMFVRLYHEWLDTLTPEQIAEKVKRFYFFYAINRHKQTVLTPLYHAEQYSPDDNRFDLRPFLINPRFSWASKKIDGMVGEVRRV